MGEARRRKLAIQQGLEIPHPLTLKRQPHPIQKLVITENARGQQIHPEVLDHIRRTAELVRSNCHDAFSRAGTSIRALVDAASEVNFGTIYGYDTATAMTPAWSEMMPQVACKKGCFYCCHINVDVTAFEAVHIWAGIRLGHLPDRREAVRLVAAKIDGLTTNERYAAHVACPLLDQGECTVYPVRPLACRGHLVPSVEACRRSFEDPLQRLDVPSFDLPVLLAAGYTTGHVAAMEDFGLASDLVELTATLALLESDSRILQRWFSGEDVLPHQRRG